MSDWFEAGGRGSPVDVAAILDSKGGAALHDLVGFGALVSLGLTSDGGALGVTITVDGRFRREYFRSAEDLELYLSEALPAVRAACEVAAASPARRERSRSTRGR